MQQTVGFGHTAEGCDSTSLKDWTSGVLLVKVPGFASVGRGKWEIHQTCQSGTG